MKPSVAKFPRRYEFRLTDEMAAAVEEWRAQQRPVPTVQEAMRELLRRQLAAEGLLRDDDEQPDAE